MNWNDIGYRVAFNLRHPDKLALNLLDKVFSAIFDLTRGKPVFNLQTPINGEEVVFSSNRNAICEFIDTLYQIGQNADGLIVELGTNAGNSTRALLAGSGGPMISVDIQDFSRLREDLSNELNPNWHFVCENDITFGSAFQEYTGKNDLPSSISILFIDTTHEYEHTIKELEVYSRLMQSGGKIVFHDTNLNRYYSRSDGTFGFGFNNNRGVARAIEDFFSISFDEKSPAENLEVTSGLFLTHIPTSCGLTILESSDWSRFYD